MLADLAFADRTLRCEHGWPMGSRLWRRSATELPPTIVFFARRSDAGANVLQVPARRIKAIRRLRTPVIMVNGPLLGRRMRNLVKAFFDGRRRLFPLPQAFFAPSNGALMAAVVGALAAYDAYGAETANDPQSSKEVSSRPAEPCCFSKKPPLLSTRQGPPIRPRPRWRLAARRAISRWVAFCCRSS